MATFQFRDREEPRARAQRLGIRVAWQSDLPDISGTHLDPRDVPGAIVSLDWADPPGSWHWAGPDWQGGASPTAHRGGITSLDVAVADPTAAVHRWAAVLGPDAERDGAQLRLSKAGQRIRFRQADNRASEGIVGCGLALEPHGARSFPTETTIGGVQFTVVPASDPGDTRDGGP